ncbi:transposon ty3-I gag-pol polyprotein [Tanacetum coccineum]
MANTRSEVQAQIRRIFLDGYGVLDVRTGSDNGAADALSRLENQSALFSLTTSTISISLFQRVVNSWDHDVQLTEIIEVGSDTQLRLELLKHIHERSIRGHSGVQVTTQKVVSIFYLKRLRREVKHLVRECLVCQKNKPNLGAYPSLLQPFPIPQGVWKSISMDFIEGLPKSNGKNVILVVMDRLSKYAYFLLLLILLLQCK